MWGPPTAIKVIGSIRSEGESTILMDSYKNTVHKPVSSGDKLIGRTL